MIDPNQITNENIFSLDYCSEERSASLAKLHHELDEFDARERRKNRPLNPALWYLLNCFGMVSSKGVTQRSGPRHGEAEEK